MNAHQDENTGLRVDGFGNMIRVEGPAVTPFHDSAEYAERIFRHYR